MIALKIVLFVLGAVLLKAIGETNHRPARGILVTLGLSCLVIAIIL